MLVMLDNWVVLLKVLKTQDKGKVRQKFLDMIHRLLLQVPIHLLLVNLLKNRNKMCLPQTEAFLMHPTLTSTGGFRISINGITILQVFLLHCHLRNAHCACHSIWILMNFTKSCRIMGSYNLSGTWWTVQRTFFGNSNSLQIRLFPLHISFFPFANKVFHWQMKFFLWKLGFFFAN